MAEAGAEASVRGAMTLVLVFVIVVLVALFLYATLGGAIVNSLQQVQIPGFNLTQIMSNLSNTLNLVVMVLGITIVITAITSIPGIKKLLPIFGGE